jgi:aspartyl-tRNA(Asn)/glutamyl-tRNA(Gln) amidotransferase subunit B
MDANVSVRPLGTAKLGTRAELKNLNSFRFLERAIQFEVERQIDLIQGGGQVVQETRLYDPNKDETRSMRSKEEANDYRYFPDPDLLPLVIEPELLAAVTAGLPELPEARRRRFRADYGLSAYDAEVLTGSRELADYFETAAAAAGDPKLTANWVMGDLTTALNRDGRDLADSPVSAAQLAALLRRILDQSISGKIAKTLFDALWNAEGDVDQLIEARGLRQITDSSAIEQAVAEVIAKNPTQVEQFRAGKEKVIGFLVGQVMQLTKGKANPQQVNELMRRQLGS